MSHFNPPDNLKYLDNIISPAAYLDLEFNFIYVNKAYAKADNREPDLFNGKNHFELYPNSENQLLFQSVIEKGESYSCLAKPFEYAEHPERGITYWDWELSPVKDDEGTIQGLLLSLYNVTERIKTQEDLTRNLLNQEIIASILNLALQPLPFKEILRQSLVLALQDSDLSLIPQGVIFLFNPDTDELNMAVCHGLPDEILTTCAHIRRGQCICGETLQQEKLIFVNCIDDHHTVSYRGMSPHGHYSVPIKSNDKFLGVLNLYVSHLHESSAAEKQYVTAIANTLASIILRERSSQALKKHQGRYQALIDTSPDLIWEIDANGIYTYASPKVYDLLGYRPEEIIGKSPFELMPQEETKRISALFGEIVANKRAFNSLVNINTHKNGKTVVLETSGVPVLSEKGELLGYRGIDRDITERQHAEETLHKQQLLLEEIADNYPHSYLYIIEKDLTISFASGQAFQKTGTNPDDSIGQSVDEIFAKDAPFVKDFYLKTFTGDEWRFELFIDNEHRLYSCVPLFDKNNTVNQILVVAEDITERLQNEETLQHSQKMDAIGQLTGGIAHDFNNMLNVILGFSNLLKAKLSNENPKLIRYCSEISQAGERARKLTSKLLEFSHKAPASADSVDMNDLLNSMQHMLETTLTARIKLKLEFENGLWHVWMDKSRMEDAILNICINAMHAMPDGGTLTLSTVTTSLTNSDAQHLNITSGDYVLISITDTGVGMDRQTRLKIFDPFFTTKGNKGTGLGMSQVYGFIKQLSGHIHVYSEPGHGTRIAIYIPRYHQSKTKKMAEVTTGAVVLPSGHETILVVDDESSLLNLVEEILTSQGYKVLCAEDADQALDILKSQSVDLLFSDVIMPGMNGYQLANEAVKLQPDIKIQLASGFNDEILSETNRDRVHQQLLQKPYTLDGLLIQIRKLLDNNNTT